jgi:hypothetical protein
VRLPTFRRCRCSCSPQREDAGLTCSSPFLLAVRAHGRKAGQAGRHPQGALQGEEGCLGLSDVDDPLVPRLLTPPPPGPCFGPHRTRPTTRLQGKGGTCAADRGAGRPWQTSCATVDAAGVGPARGHLESTRHGGRHYISHLIARPACPIPRRSCRRGTRRRLWFRVDARPQTQLRRRTCGPIHPGTEPKPEGLRCG